MARQTTESSFDELTRGLASGTLSRGRALRLMGAALVGGTLGSLGISEAAADDDDRCSEGQTRCGERCVNLKTNERHCGSCRNRCGSNQTCCKGRCVNLRRNERHCGRCFNRCPSGQECVGGMCQGGCRSGTTECGTQCCQTGETCLHGIACCPDAQVCGTGAFAICCPSAATCVDGFCECDDPDALACGDQCVACEGGTVNSELCLCECPSDHTLIGSTCCPDAQVCGTGTTLACCAQGEQCGVDGVCGPACVSDGGSCGIDSDCCSGLLCDNGTCATCRSSGGSCADGEMCCDNGFCEANGTCCSRIGGRCFTYEDCCGSIPGTCSPSGFCTI